MFSLEFTGDFVYSSQIDGIRLPVTLRAGGNELEIFAYVDTGATYCLFQREYGELLGLNVEAGQRLAFSTVAGSVEAYGHMVNLECLGLSMESAVFSLRTSVFRRTSWDGTAG